MRLPTHRRVGCNTCRGSQYCAVSDRQGYGSAIGGGSHHAPFLGRATEVQALARCLHAVATGRAITVFIEGEAGIGKTRFLHEALAASERRGLQVLSASGDELERSRPFGMLADALAIRVGSPDPERAAIADLLRGEAAQGFEDSSTAIAAGPNLAYRVVEDIVSLTERLASASPVVLALDDLQWADPSTLVALHALARRLRDLPLGIVCTYRPSPRSPELARFVEAQLSLGATHLTLARLAEDDVDTLAAALIGAPPGPTLRAQLQRGHGNPFYVLELVEALAAADDLAIVGGRAEAAGPALPPSLRLVLLRRLSYLPVETVETLTLAAVLGSSFDVAQLALVARRPVVELMGVLDEALRAGVLAEAGTCLAFRHDLIREALYSELALPIRTGLHLEVGRALAEAGAPVSQVAEHLALGARPGDTDAVSWLHEAARGEQSRAPAVAAELLTRARGIAGPHHPAADALSADLVIALAWSGRFAAAEAEALEVLARSHDPSVESVVRFGLITALLAQGKTPEAQRQAQAALAHPGLAGWARARLTAQAAFGPIFMGDLPGGMAAAHAALVQAEESGDDLAACVALCALCAVALFEGRLHDGVAHAVAAVERAERSSTPAAATWHSNIFLGWALDACERPAEAEEALRRGRRLSEELGAALSLPIYQWVLVWGRFVVGQWDDATAEAQAGLVVADEVGSRIGVVAVHAMLAMIALHRNDLRQARRAVETGEAELARSGPQPLVEWVATARAAVEEAGGDIDTALAALTGAWDSCAARGEIVEFPRLGPDLVRLLVATGQRERACAVVAQVDDVAPRMNTKWARAAALRCRGMLDGDQDLLCEAVGVLRGSPRPLERGKACEEAARALSDAAQTTKATAMLDEAIGIYDELGAARDIAQVEATLRSLGRRPSRRGWRQRQAKVGWEALTRTELEVATLAGEGLTNREVAERLYISPRTVETHMTHVFAKLGLSSRLDLRAEVARRQTDAQGLPAPPRAPGAGRASR